MALGVLIVFVVKINDQLSITNTKREATFTESLLNPERKVRSVDRDFPSMKKGGLISYNVVLSYLNNFAKFTANVW